MIHFAELKKLLDKKSDQYNRPEFIIGDPSFIPHQFSKKNDIEISALFAATFAWGQRITTVKKCLDLMKRMDNSPYDFILNHGKSDLKKLLGFKHRTFNDSDLLYFIAFLKHHFTEHKSLESAFFKNTTRDSGNAIRVENALKYFHNYFFSLNDFPDRTKKHISTPERNSTCKRLNMFLRWMVRQDNNGVDFGIWKSISPSELLCPLDVHVNRVARELGLVSRKQTDWQTVLELTENLKKMNPQDPVKYDFALFGMGVMEK